MTGKDFGTVTVTMYSMQATTFPLVSHMTQVNRESESAARCSKDRLKIVSTRFKDYKMSKRSAVSSVDLSP